MWDRLLVDCNIATLQGVGLSLGIIDNGAIGIADGNIVRVGKRTELAGYRAKKVDALGGAWVTPGLIDCHTHLIFGGNRADEHAMRRAGASYEEIAKAGGGIASTVAKTKAELVKYLRDSFDYGNRVLATINAQNALQRVDGPYAGPNSRLATNTSILR